MSEPSPKKPNGILGHFREHYVAYGLATMLALYTETKTDDRYTGRMGEAMENRVRNIEDKLNTLPPRELLERVTRLEAKLEFIEKVVDEEKRKNGRRVDRP